MAQDDQTGSIARQLAGAKARVGNCVSKWIGSVNAASVLAVIIARQPDSGVLAFNTAELTA
jgi:hypothetical protein